ncbi:mitochondrial carrier domain-containing protein [Kockiozyma suomiensis]|uniref:mitochondrial carrier domain-containing protein n=1 Tax=Kockiozyma suomiensis TaxID=1337062 RepID=UPI003343F6EE
MASPIKAVSKTGELEDIPLPPPLSPAVPSNRYAGFVAGIFSGVTKLFVGHPFDTIKVRLQTAPAEQFKGPLDCFLQTTRKEGFRALYKGATPPLLGWMAMDSVQLGSLHNYRMLMKAHVFTEWESLPPIGHAISGIFAGWTVSFVAAPIEQVKARLQVQYNDATKTYTGPIHCAMTLYKQAGIKGLYRGLFSTMIFRSYFFFLWGSYDIMTHWAKANTNMSTASINFWAGGLSAQLFWTLAYPSDVVKQTIMIDSVTQPKFKHWIDAFRHVYSTRGYQGFFRGFIPSSIRAFPANASALAMFELVMRTMV